MTYVAVLLACANAALAAVFGGLIRSLIRQHHRERDLLVNQLLHLAGRSWQPPPAAPDSLPEFDPDDGYIDRFADPAMRPEL